MAMYVKRSCPKCATSINGWALHHVKFGSPIIQCSNCKTPIKVDNINEWALLDGLGKMEYCFSLLWTICATGMGVPLIVISFLALAFNMKHYFIVKDNSSLTLTAALILFVGVASSAFYYLRFFLIELRKSNERLADVKYREFLQSNGLLKR